MEKLKLLVGGRLVEGDRDLQVVNPATGDVFATVGCASAVQIDQAVAAASEASPMWAATTSEQRRAVLLKIADIAEANAEELAGLLTQEQGKPIAIAVGEVMVLAAFFRYVAGLDLSPEVVEDGEARQVKMYRRPLGVVAAIVPWNFPLAMLGGKVPAALMAGNCIVVKPAGTTPVATLRFAELIHQVVPAGVINIVADANDLGDVLVGNPDVRKVSFTGSTEIGKRVMAKAAGTLKRLTLELGGNDAGIVLDDADPAAVAPGIFQGAFFNSGQVCVALKRLYVHESIYDAVVDELVRIANNAIVGNGFTEGVQLGPIQNKAQFQRILDLLEDARAHGQVVAGGEAVPGPGYFVRPTIVRDIQDGTRLVDEEQFGPLLPIIKYSDLDDAILRANASSMGLGGSVWSSDKVRALDVASRMECGTVWINKHGDLAPNIPFGGAKLSGMGVEFALAGLHEMTQVQVVNA